ncbi:MAG: hypothetical protein WCQ69_04085 [Bacteroidales bacterium]|jgi:hypothetical protein|nr:hypothetical protein [Bacteroidales bacterium]MDD2263654.1 hypothetical protein [Bacteroidales bacterium]MDD2830555.1 hypothetical protein [Bacteroidales bacterium]MDD3208824.1 hypothetical protein [Bacteroidales bacterium]MDD3697451.1 hypothetical protein [Bacteroidales bacterium]
MKNFLTIVLAAMVLTAPSGISAQTVKRGVVKAVIGSDLNEVLPNDVVYMYPEFQTGTLIFKNKSSAEATMNLYLPGSNLHFLGPRGDTLVVKNQDEALYLYMGNDTYIRHSKSWIRLLSAWGNLAFGIRTTVSIQQPQKTGAYGMVDVTSSITEYSSMEDQTGRTMRLQSLKNIPYTVTHDAMLYDGNKLYLASRRNYKKLFPHKKEFIDQYIKENNLDLGKAQDALQLFNLLNL